MFSGQRLLLPVGSLPTAVATADLDGDGRLDLVTPDYGLGTQTGTLTVFFQLAPRTFTAQQLPLVAGSFPTSVAAADLNDDGLLDIVCSHYDVRTLASALTVFFQVAPHLFAPRQLPLAVGSLPVSVAAADLDSDGRLDLVCANRGSNNLTVLFQDEARVFTAHQVLLDVGSGPVSVAIVDLDGDGSSRPRLCQPRQLATDDALSGHVANVQ